ncbi:invasion associated locus B family protein [Mangrovicoccus sp. HB161399]|uniref:invasion associated locus B family protein n=1 Tax=Mangrovicoccus sp. HB161399 TaxID=2720392 RepID=UPI0015571962|nr:invasion associated locus B family protein [Mangrovicoccus sp. HB161399]
MTNRLGAGLLLSLTFALATTAAVAQDQAQPAPADGAGGETAGLSAGEPAAPRERPTSRDQVQPGQLYVPKTVQDWEIRCGRAPDGQTDPCQMYQLLRDGSGTPTAEFTLFRIEGAAFVAGAMIVTPLETLLPHGVAFSVDGGPPKRYPFKYCNPTGCVAEVGFSADDIAAMKRGAKGTVTIVPVVAQNTNVDLSLSLSGFTASYDGLPPRQVAPAQQPPQQ